MKTRTTRQAGHARVTSRTVLIALAAVTMAASATAVAHATDRDAWFDQSLAKKYGDGWETNMANDDLYFGLNLVNKDGRCQIEIRQIKYYTSKLEYRLIHIPTSVFNVFKKGYSATSGPMTVEYFTPTKDQYGEYHLQWWFTPGDNGPTKRPNPKVNYPGGCPSATAAEAAKPSPTTTTTAAAKPAESPAPLPMTAPTTTITKTAVPERATIPALARPTATTSSPAQPVSAQASAQAAPPRKVTREPSAALPKTGYDPGSTVWFAGGVAGAGVLLLLTARRRPARRRR